NGIYFFGFDAIKNQQNQKKQSHLIQKKIPLNPNSKVYFFNSFLPK
ncbi:MAG: hypothetical protein RLZZ628_2044, partial [Bacteroidota bacterium]